MKQILFIFLLCVLSLPVMAEHPSCFVNRIAIEGSITNIVGLQMRDQDNLSPTPIYNGHIYLDDPTMTSTTDVLQVISSGGTGTYTIANAAFGNGSINPMDGAQHTFYFTMDSNTQGTLTNCSGNGWPYKYNLAGVQNDYTYSLYQSASAAATPSNVAVIANSQDTYSIGSSGTPVCTVNSTTIKDDGVVGYYVKQYSIPCGHVHVVSLSTAASNISTATAASAYAAMSPAFGSDEQFIAIGWMTPYYITGITSAGTAGTLSTAMSIPGYFANHGSTISEYTITTSGSVFPGDPVTGNPYFRSNSFAPFTDYGIRPAWMLAWAKATGGSSNTVCAGNVNFGVAGCWQADFTTAATRIDQSIAAKLSNPTGGQINLFNSTTDILRSSDYLLSSPLAYGNNTGVAPSALNVTISGASGSGVTGATVTQSNILAYMIAAQGAAVASTPSFVHSGVGYLAARTSISAALDGTQQPPITLYTQYGASWSCGSTEEPVGMATTKVAPETMLFVSGWTRGMTAIEATWKATRYPWNVICVGDGLNQPFSNVYSSQLLAVSGKAVFGSGR